jgi:hypothetical protein
MPPKLRHQPRYATLRAAAIRAKAAPQMAKMIVFPPAAVDPKQPLAISQIHAPKQAKLQPLN